MVPLPAAEQFVPISGRPFFLLPLWGDSAGELEQRTAEATAWGGDTDLGVAATRLWDQVPADAPHRRVVLASSVRHAQESLATMDTRWVRTMDPDRVSPQVAFCFSGLGESPVVLGDSLYRTNAEFRQTLDRLDRLSVAHHGRSLVLGPLRSSAPAGRADDRSVGLTASRALLGAARRTGPPVVEPPTPALPTEEDQPMRWAVGYALARTWLAAGVAPDLLVGHSLGEYVAACVAGVFTEEDALRLVIRRAELLGGLPAGGMLAVGLPAREVSLRLPDGAVVSAMNAPSVTAVSGSHASLRTLAEDLARDGVSHRFLPVDRPFHSPLLDPVSAPLAAEVARVQRKRPQLRWISTVTGRLMRPQDAVDPQYWARHTTAPVNYLAALRLALRGRPPAFLEVGLGEALTTFAAHTQLESAATRTPVLASVQRSPYWQNDTTSWLHTLGWLWTSGLQVNWRALSPMTTSPHPVESDG
ncbi:acyl transferase domain-containing protein [Kitasatospora sp. GAS204A]|nr:acyl transferase domain-containing protein [Kitasatospora sp. GAS204B]